MEFYIDLVQKDLKETEYTNNLLRQNKGTWTIPQISNILSGHDIKAILFLDENSFERAGTAEGHSNHKVVYFDIKTSFSTTSEE